MELLTRIAAGASTAEALCLPGYSLDSTEALSALIRVAGGFRCPCKRRTLLDEVQSSLVGLGVSVDRDRLKTTLEAMLSYGDLIEAETRSADSGDRVTHVYARPPSFVCRDGGDVLLLGLGELDQLPLPLELQTKVVHKAHTRRLSGEGVASRLRDNDLIEIPADAWGWRPQQLGPEALVEQYDLLLDAAPDTRDLAGVRFLDSRCPVDFYPGRWRESVRDAGRYLVRRSRRYGSDLWGYARVEAGEVVQLIDLMGEGPERACDRAWRLQLAIDKGRGYPQQFSVRAIEGRDTQCLSLFSPVPQWVQRRWDNLGDPVDVHGALLSYEFAQCDATEEASFCEDALWLQQVDKGIARERMEA
ncbi:MAG: hypothetical protein Q7J82_02935 [Coriobacteriia bacterium]|nr:hypothetical protein [Coriobacteriia bacterium]